MENNMTEQEDTTEITAAEFQRLITRQGKGAGLLTLGILMFTLTPVAFVAIFVLHFLTTTSIASIMSR